MALIPLEGLGAPSQKTSLLGGVAQILIYLRSSPRLADVRPFVRSKSQHSIPKRRNIKEIKIKDKHTNIAYFTPARGPIFMSISEVQSPLRISASNGRTEQLELSSLALHIVLFTDLENLFLTVDLIFSLAIMVSWGPRGSVSGSWRGVSSQ